MSDSGVDRRGRRAGGVRRQQRCVGAGSARRGEGTAIFERVALPPPLGKASVHGGHRLQQKPFGHLTVAVYPGTTKRIVHSHEMVLPRLAKDEIRTVQHA